MLRQANDKQVALQFKPNLQDLEISEGKSESDASQNSGGDSEEGEDAASGSEESDDAPVGVYKAPKNAKVAYVDKKMKKEQQKDSYVQKRTAKSDLVQELRREMMDEPEEVYMGASRKTKTSKYEDKIEQQEMMNFKRV